MAPLALRRAVEELRRYDKMVGIWKIARRYFVNNAFDGLLTATGLVLGSWLAQVHDPAVILRTGFSTALAIGVSGFWGAYMTEAAERRDDLARLGRQTLTDLTDSRLGRAVAVASRIIAVVDGLSPFLAAALVLVPFFFTPWAPSIHWIYGISLATAFTALFVLGVFLGCISGRGRIRSGLLMLVAGLLSAALSYLIS
ncbi:hypothetical protein G3N55_11175 [Dissulfurirhabdus thermomarina]|uniref:VIT family protein n=1 Tax=Dissulfurirhabdus thermomarina TaxID=1765737 RepID=A0A6N9TQE2_DISTH|nr:VIT1/CCC1 transporter family protein [Dissulfurirhabdus thermomarina]NDY43399.1 hypothetical protein [Dissulfurirhabdus thermomarina]NMX23641.1 hypothetical protein [Dissulfurirhabdus thermomarina]